ncbi:Flp family type IVb pilin [Pseudaeromonas sp. ZJS20]|uniref:Flp family type IVb pilin n=1 Tax=Pseudaeromonas aegiceratis TaxID=3153928 RepID=UPI00390C93B7
MNKLTNMMRGFWQDEEGLTTVEYAVAGTLVALAVVTAFTDLGTAVGTSINNLVTAISG